MNEIAFEEKRKHEREKLINFLRGYSLNRKLLVLDRYEKQFMKASSAEEMLISESSLARPRMYEVRNFIMSLDNSDEKLLLYYHFIKGESVEKCAELLKISRRSAFRLKRRALAFAGRKLEKYFEDQKNGVR